jgi:hypothetical protein
MQQMTPASLYTRLGGYDAIAAVVNDLLERLPQIRCSAVTGPAPEVRTPTIASANWQWISSLHPLEDRPFTWAVT